MYLAIWLGGRCTTSGRDLREEHGSSDQDELLSEREMDKMPTGDSDEND